MGGRDRLKPVPPGPTGFSLSPRQRLIYWLLFLFCAGTRFLAMARSLWDWDEALFCLGMRAYDVTSHHPHPPGFPVYIGLGRLVRLLVHDDFRALQAINLAAGMLVFPAVFMLARELRFRFVTAAIAGTLCAFLPNVWFFGGTAFSDVPSIVLVVFAVALLFRGCRDANAYIAGAFLLALAVGIRPQNFLIGLFPGALATWYRARQSWRDVVFAALIGVITVGVAFGGAIAATGTWRGYLNTVRTHGDYITAVDSFRSAARPPLWRLVDRFFIKQYDEPVLSFVTSLFVLVSIAGAIRARDRAILYLALSFGPFAILAWLMLDRYSVSRFSIGYIPMFALLAADGMGWVARGRGRWEGILGAALVGSFFFWTLPALTTVRETIAPLVLAAQKVNEALDPRRDFLFVAQEMTPFVEYFAPYVRFHPSVRRLDFPPAARPPLEHRPAALLRRVAGADAEPFAVRLRVVRAGALGRRRMAVDERAFAHQAAAGQRGERAAVPLQRRRGDRADASHHHRGAQRRDHRPHRRRRGTQ